MKPKGGGDKEVGFCVCGMFPILNDLKVLLLCL